MGWITEKVFNLITAAVALYGAVLSTVNCLRGMRRLRVTVHHHVLVGPVARKHMLGIEMANVGKVTITVVASSFKYAPPLPDGSTATIADPDLPKEIQQG